jgi:hypothetical protein
VRFNIEYRKKAKILKSSFEPEKETREKYVEYMRKG